MRFVKYHGCGNDFILMDNRSQDFCPEPGAIRFLTDRHTGVGGDGVILLEESFAADVKMRIFNADGTEAEMCGNGARCFILFLAELGFPLPADIEVSDRVLSGTVAQNGASIEMGIPWDIALNIDSPFGLLHRINTGVPHAVVFVDDLDHLDIETSGRAIRHDSLFSPEGTNVTFVQKVSRGRLAFSTYERGVEGETLACGTGACAAALIAHLIDGTPSPIEVVTKRGDVIEVGLSDRLEVTMSGPAARVFEGSLTENSLKTLQLN